MAELPENKLQGSSGTTSAPINYFKEKLILQEEEKQLKKMLERFQDQQNRLKIEELALLSMMKMEKEKLEKGESATRSAAGSSSSRAVSSVTSDEMADYAVVGFLSEDPSVINQQALDLNVAQQPGYYGHVYQNLEEEMDSEEEKEQVDAADKARTHQLMSFMEDF